MPTPQSNVDDSGNQVTHGAWENRVYNPVTRTYDSFLVVEPLVINPTRKALRIEIIPRTLPPANVPDRMPIYDSRNAYGGLTNDVAETLTPLSADVISGLPALRLDVTIVP